MKIIGDDGKVYNTVEEARKADKATAQTKEDYSNKLKEFKERGDKLRNDLAEARRIKDVAVHAANDIFREAQKKYDDGIEQLDKDKTEFYKNVYKNNDGKTYYFDLSDFAKVIRDLYDFDLD